jgi:hypothetical protein
MIEGRYAQVNSKIACVTCAAQERDASRRMGATTASSVSQSSLKVPAATGGEEPSSPFLQAAVFGAGAAVMGMIVYASFTIITHFYIGYVAVLVGWMVGAAMMKGSSGAGGLRYQAVAVVLTYLAISLSSIPIHLARAADAGVAIDWATMWPTLLMDGIASPFLVLTRTGYGIIRLFILFLGLRVAFQIASGKPWKKKAKATAIL